MSMSVKPVCLDLQEVAQFISMSPSSVQKMVRKDLFPKPRMLSKRRVAWLTREVEEWAESRLVSDILPPKNTARKASA